MYTPQSHIRSVGIGSAETWMLELRRRGADDPVAIVNAYIKYGTLIGYNWDLSLAQGILECTGFTDYKWTEYRNPAGIGSTSRNEKGAVFDSIEAGITAQYAHQAGYAETEATCPIEMLDETAYANLFNDPRHNIINHRGQPEVAYWDGHWAVPGDGYSQHICNIANQVLKLVVQGPPEPPPPLPPSSGRVWPVVDLRAELTRNPSGGPNERTDLRLGQIFHYNGPPPNPDAETQYRNDAADHSRRDFGGGYIGDGIMYHWGIGMDGTRYQLRDENEVLWHCASWVPGANGSGLSVNINIGEGQHATAEAIESAADLAVELGEKYGYERDMVKGHQEVSATACPGTLMDDLVRPFRAGVIGGGTTEVVEADGFLHENGHIIGGGFKAMVDALESVSHDFRMKILGYVLTEEMDGFLLSPETLTSGVPTGRYHVKEGIVQMFERGTPFHDPQEPNPYWQDVLPLSNRGYLAGIASDPEIAAILNGTDTIVHADARPGTI